MKLNEVQDLFKDMDVIKLDPDRADVYDVVNALMPTLVRMSYTFLVDDKRQHERTHTDEDDAKFDFDTGALIEMVNETISTLRKRLSGVDDGDIKQLIDTIKGEFTQPLTESFVSDRIPAGFTDMVSKFLGFTVSKLMVTTWLYGGGNPFEGKKFYDALNAKCNELFGSDSSDLSERDTVKLFMKIGLDAAEAKLLLKQIYADS